MSKRKKKTLQKLSASTRFQTIESVSDKFKIGVIRTHARGYRNAGAGNHRCGPDLTCPRGEWGDANAVREQWSKRSAKRDHDTRDAEIHVTALQVGVTIAQTRIHKKKIVR